MRPWARWFSSRGTKKGMNPSLGLTDENGKFVWESTPKDEGHEFRSYVYEKMRYRKQPHGESAGKTSPPYA